MDVADDFRNLVWRAAIVQATGEEWGIMKLKEIIGDAIIIWFGAMSLVIFVSILIRGYAYLYENFRPLLILEISLCPAIIWLGIDRLKGDL